MTRAWQPREQRLVSEYLVEAYPGAIHMLRVRLGSLEPENSHGDLTEEEQRMLGVMRRWADAVVIKKDEVVLIEASIRMLPGKISQLETYGLLLPKTPELKQYLDRPVRLELVYALYDPVVYALAQRRQIRCVQYFPPWLDDYLQELYPRERRTSQARGFKLE